MCVRTLIDMTEAIGPAPAMRPGAVHRLRRARVVAVTVLAVSATLISSMMVLTAEGFVPGQQEIEPGWRAGVGFFVAVGAAIALCWRHRNPALVTGIAVLPPLVFITDALAALIAMAALAAGRRDHVLWIGAAGVYAATAVAVGHDARRHVDYSPVQWVFGAQAEADRVDVPLLAVLLIAAVMTAIPVGVGLLLGAKRDLTRSEQTGQELLAEMTRQEERSRIAREMHDVLGHRLSLLSLQAGALEVGRDQVRAAEVARTVRGTARQALDDLRHVIGVLRDGQGFAVRDSQGRPSEPRPPTLPDLPDLIANSRRSGLAVNVTVLLDDAASAPAPLGAAAYRIVQESLTNVLRHASGAAAEVSVRGGPGVGLTLEVANPLPDAGPAEPMSGSGTGLAGIAERASMLGGKVSAGPTDKGYFVVAAWLPWPK